MKLATLHEGAEDVNRSVAFRQAVLDFRVGRLSDFECTGQGVTSLEGSPREVGGNFDVGDNRLTSLTGGPVKVGGDYVCGTNHLESCVGAANVIGGSFLCGSNKLKSFEGFPSIICEGHTSTPFATATFPSRIMALDCWGNNFTSLKDIHKHIKEANGTIHFSKNPITSHVLGVLKIKGVTAIMLDHKKVREILNRHLAGDRDLLACQEELMDAGLEEFAQL